VGGGVLNRIDGYGKTIYAGAYIKQIDEINLLMDHRN
jgi:hypothetical protein